MPDLLLLGDLLDGAGRAHLPAEDARVLAVADARDEDRRPEPLDARLEERRVERVVRAHLHALGAADAALEERALLDRARRADDLRRGSSRRASRRRAPRAGTSRPRPSRRARCAAAVSGTVIVLRRFGRNVNLMTSSGQAFSQFMHMWHSSCRHFTPPCGRVGALAVDEAQVAVGALRVVLRHPEEREAREDAEERAERAEDAAPEARDEAVREEDRDEQEDDEPGLVEVELLASARRSARGSPACGRRRPGRRASGRPAPRRGRGATRYCSARDDAEADRADRDADRIEEAADGAAGDAGDEERVEQVVLRALVGVRLVRLDARRRRARACSAGASRRSGGASRTGRSTRRRRARRPA